MDATEEDEDAQLRSVALQNAAAIQVARLRAERDLLAAKEALEQRSRELAQSLAVMRATLESTTNGILAVAETGQITTYNQRFVDMWDVPGSTLSARTHDRLIDHMASKALDAAAFRSRVRETVGASEIADVIELRDGRVFERVSRPQRIGERNVGRVWSFSDITARQRDERQRHEDARLLELLNESGQAIASKLDLEETIQAVTDAGTRLCGAAFGAFFYTNTDAAGGKFMLYTLSGAPREAFERFGHPRATDVFGPTFRGEGPIRSDDILADPRYGKWGPHHGMPPGHLPVRSYLAMPVVSRSGEVIGGLFFGHPETAMFTERTARSVVSLAAQAAVAIDNARLYEAAQKEIAERKQAEEALRLSGERMRFMAEAMPQKIFTAAAGGKIESVNAQFTRYTGMTAADLADGAWARVIHPDELAAFSARWEAAIARGEPMEHEHRLRDARGEYRWHLTRARAMNDESGNVVLWIGSSTDIDDLKRAAEERAALLDSERSARTEVERTSRMKDEFLATLSHELRTPLNAILGWSQILGRSGNSDASLKQGLQTIERNARAQTQLIEDLLDMSRIISGKIRLDIQPVEPLGFIEAAIEAVMPAASAKGIRIEKLLDPSAGPIAGDPSRLQQVVWNLLSNALKFTSRDGKIQVLLERVNSHIEISVSDNGTGIDPEFLPHVFERFRQADSTTTRKFGGLGLGLSIVKQLVELHGGTVRVKSGGLGQGATFMVNLPVAIAHKDRRRDQQHPTAARAEPLELATVNLGGLTILVVDDEADARDLVRRLLEDCGARVLTAARAEEALATVERERPDLMVSDIGMPDADGYELLRRVRALGAARGGRVPAVALTAFARSEDRTRALRAGFAVHVSKPVEPSELIATVAAVAGRSGTPD